MLCRGDGGVLSTRRCCDGCVEQTYRCWCDAVVQSNRCRWSLALIGCVVAQLLGASVVLYQVCVLDAGDEQRNDCLLFTGCGSGVRSNRC